MTPPTTTDLLAQVIEDSLVRPVYQSVVDLSSGAVVGYEALARGPEGPLHGPVALFGAAREAGRLVELDAICRTAAIRHASAAGIDAPATLFVNVEPEALDREDPATLLAASKIGRTVDLPVVLEITERALAERPAELLRTVERARELGWRIALDDVGMERASLTFIPLLSPDVVKLDLSLVQRSADADLVEVVHAVSAYAEESGALLLAEGIETEEHRQVALSLGATLGQGWLFSRPAEVVDPSLEHRPLRLAPWTPTTTAASPFAALPTGTPLRQAPKRLLIELSKHLEEQAARTGRTAVLASTFQEARHFTPATARRYGRLSSLTGFVAVLGEGISHEPVPGVRGSGLAATDPVLGEWDVVVAGPDTHAALLARDLGDHGPELERRFEYALTFRPHVVRAALQAVVARIEPADPVGVGGERPRLVRPRSGTATPGTVAAGAEPGALAFDAMAQRALGASTSGLTIVDVLAPDQPLVYVNAAFETLTGLSRADLMGRNCRFLQGPDTDRATAARMAAGIAAGREVRETLVNYRGRGSERRAWWNEVVLSPVHDETGRVVQYVGVQNDVTEKVLAEQSLRDERDRAAHYRGQLELLAYSDALTGLPNRRAIEDRVEVELGALAPARSLGLLFLDLDHFKAVNDAHGHAAGDELLGVIGRRLRGAVAGSDVVARLGGDEFLIGVVDLPTAGAAARMDVVAGRVREAVSEPIEIGTERFEVTTSTGYSLAPQHGRTFGELMHLADLAMYAAKDRGRPARRWGASAL